MPLSPFQVKTQFGNHPHIYNQFLEIMKNFKAQAYVSRARVVFEKVFFWVGGRARFFPHCTTFGGCVPCLSRPSPPCPMFHVHVCCGHQY